MKMKQIQSGFTIVELLVTIAVAGVVIGSLSQVVTTYVHTAQRGRYLNLANAWSEAEIETLRNTGYNGISLGTSSLSGQLPSQLPLSRAATMVVTSPSGGIKQIVLTVTYKDQAQTRTLTYTTYVGELGVGQ